MERKYFPLINSDNNRIVRSIRIVFGIICTLVAVYWIIFNITTVKRDGTVWITIFFLTGFGLFQIMEGLGLTKIFIEFENGNIRLKKNPVFPAVKFCSSDIEKIDLHPLNVIFRLKSGEKINLRFGATQVETNELIKDVILDFADEYKVSLEVVEEKV